MGNRISAVLDLDAKGFNASLKTTIANVRDAHGFTGKLKAGLGGLGDSLKQFAKSPAGIATMAGGIAAAGTAAFEAASKWADLGVEVGKFATATGMSDEAASRWIETSKDLGVEAGSTEKSIGFMNKTLGKSPALFDKFGVTISKTASGAIDANGTFLNVIQTLKDISNPAEQAAAGAALLGRSWQDMAEFIAQGSAGLSKSLASVEEQKIFDEAKVAKAKEFRATMDKLGDSFEDLALELGEKVLPLVEELVGGITDVVKAVDKVIDVTTGIGDRIAAPWRALTGTGADHYIDSLVEKMNKLQEPITETDRETRRLTGAMGKDLPDAFDKFNGSAVTAQNTMRGYSYAEKDAKDTTDRLAAATQAAKDKSEAFAESLEKQRKRVEDLTSAERSAVDAKYAYRDATSDAQSAIDDYNETLRKANTDPSTDGLTLAQQELTLMVEQANRVTGTSTSTDEEKKAAQEALATSQDKYNEAVKEYNDALAAQQDALGQVDSKQRAAEDAVLRASEAYATLNGAALDSEAGIRRQIQALIDQEAVLAPGSPLRTYLDEWIADLKAIPEHVSTTVDLNVSQGGANTGQGAPGYGPRSGGPRARGGPTWPGAVFPVGEGGKPELYTEGGAQYLIPGANGQVTPMNGAASGGAPVVNITVHAGLATDGYRVGQQVVNALTEHGRRNGWGWLSKAS